MRLRAFLELLEAHGGGEIRACELEAALAKDGREARSALRSQGILRSAPRAETVPCDGLGCAREVRELGSGGARRFFGVCTRDPAECETIEVGEDELAQEIVSRDAFLAAVQRALKLTPSAHVPPGLPGEVVALGEETVDGEARDVFLVWRSDARTLLRAPPREVAGAGRSVRVLTLAALSDLLTVRDGQLAELPRLGVVPRRPSTEPPPAAPAVPPAHRPPRSPALEGLRHVERWGEITLFDVDEDDLVGVTFDTRLRRLSCVDFGLATVNGRKPIDVFVLLKTVCRGNGLFVTRAFGSASNGKRLMSELRAAMRTTFGIDSDPFEPYSRRTHDWKPKFRALAGAPAEVEAAMREWKSTKD